MPALSLVAPPGQIENILTPQEIQLIKQGYNADPAWLANYSQYTYDGLYPGGARAFDSFNKSIFIHGDPPKQPLTGIGGKERERVIIGILASTPNPFFLAIHQYWGLAEGLTPLDMCQIMLVVGGYSGYEYYTSGLSTLAKTLNALKVAASDGIPVPPQTALAALQQAFA